MLEAHAIRCDVEVGRDRRRRRGRRGAARADRGARARGCGRRGGRRCGVPPGARLLHAERGLAQPHAGPHRREPQGRVRRLLAAGDGGLLPRAAPPDRRGAGRVRRRGRGAARPGAHARRRSPILRRFRRAPRAARDQAVQPRPQAARAVVGGVPRALDRRARRAREAAARPARVRDPHPRRRRRRRTTGSRSRRSTRARTPSAPSPIPRSPRASLARATSSPRRSTSISQRST